MHRIALTCSLLGSLALAGCTLPTGQESAEGPSAQAKDAIAYGAADLMFPHTAVLALIGTTSMGEFECSGSIVQVKNGNAYVLTAAHCCNDGAPSTALIGAKYNMPTATYNVDASSIYYDSSYNGNDHDFCMLKFAVSGTPDTLKLPT